MRDLIPFLIAAALLGGAVLPALAGQPLSRDALIEDFKTQPETRWRFLTDQVMGTCRPATSLAQVCVATVRRRAVAR